MTIVIMAGSRSVPDNSTADNTSWCVHG